MKFVIDTSSLLSFVRYYQPFDDEDILFNKIKSSFSEKQIILLDSVKEEIGSVSKGLVIEKLGFLKSVKTQKKVEVEKGKTHRRIDNNWCNKRIKNQKELASEEYEKEREAAIDGADFQLILYALELKGSDVSVVTEESSEDNDSKMFLKMPKICSHERIRCITLPTMLEEIGVQVTYQ